MRLSIITILSILVLVYLITCTLFGQVNTQTIYLKDGAKFQGKIIAQNDSIIVLETQYGTLDINKGEIVKQEKVDNEIQQIYLNNGTVLNGVITLTTSDSLYITTDFGPLVISKSQVKNISDSSSLLTSTLGHPELILNDLKDCFLHHF